MIKRQYFVKVWMVLGVLAILYLINSAHSNIYFPAINAPYTQILSILCGIFACILKFNGPLPKIERRLNIIWGSLLIALGFATSVALNMCGVYIWCALWIIAGVNILLEERKKIKLSTNTYWLQFNELKIFNQSGISSPKNEVSQNLNISEEEEPITPKPILNYLFFINALVIGVFSFVAFSNCYYHTQYPPIGTMIKVQLPNKLQSVSFHTYCSSLHSSRSPTLILEHRRIGNLIGFLPIIQELEKMGIKSCVYDQLGYGRSSKVPPNLNPKQQIDLTHKMLENIIGENEMVVYGGWNQGVQNAIFYQYYFPEYVKALIFLNGYPNLNLLDPIRKQQYREKLNHQYIFATILRLFEPLGVDFFYGNNQIGNDTTNSYYKAYSRTGYLWDSQITDLRSKLDTSWIEELNQDQDPKWPKIFIPLLIISDTGNLSRQNGSLMQLQNEEYLQKCMSQNKKIQKIDGGNDFPLVNPVETAKKIQEFIISI